MGRKRRIFTTREIARVNLLYLINGQTLTAAARSIGSSPKTVERVLFKTRNEFYIWNFEQNLKEYLK